MKVPTRSRRCPRLPGLLIAASVSVALLPQALARPGAHEVVQGSAQVQRVSPALTNVVQASDRAVINWQSFDIDQPERVNFQQPSVNAAVLNRVVGPGMTTIAGQLSANGMVYLINPQGVLFANGAQVDVGALIASTADIADQSFMAGNFVFDRASSNRTAEINVSAGAQILAGNSAGEAGLVALVAPRVRHAGIIQADAGTVLIGGAPTFTLDLNGDGLYSFALTGDVGDRSAASVDVSGELVAERGRVHIAAATAGEVVSNVINVSGRVFARTASVDEATGSIILDGCAGTGCGGVALATSGLLDASAGSVSGAGGGIDITGTNVALSEGSIVNVSGPGAGGRIDVEGSGSAGSVTLAGQTFALGGAGTGGAIEVNGATVVVGGDLVVDSSDGGAGGTIELFGQQLELESGSTLTASGGTGGLVTLDFDADVTMAVGAGGIFARGTAGTGGVVDVDTGVASIGGALVADSAGGTGGTIDIQATSEVVVGAGGVLDTSGESGGTVLLTGQSSRVEDTALVIARGAAANGGVITLNAADVELRGDVVADGGTGGQVTIDGARLRLEGTATIDVSGEAGGGSIELSATGSEAELDVSAGLVADGGTGEGGSISLTGTSVLRAGGTAIAQGSGGGSVAFSGGAAVFDVATLISTSGQVSYAHQGTDTLTIGGGEDSTANVHVESLSAALQGGAATVVDAPGIEVAGVVDGRPASGPGGSLSLQAEDGIAMGPASALLLADATLAMTAGGGAGIVIDPTESTGTGDARIATGAGDVVLTSTGGGVSAHGIATSGDVSITAAGSVLVGSALGGAVDSSGNPLASENPLIGSLTIDAGTAGEVTLTAVRSSGAVDVTGSVVNVDGEINSGGAVQLNGGEVYLRRSIFTRGQDITILAERVWLEPTGPVRLTEVLGAVDDDTSDLHSELLDVAAAEDVTVAELLDGLESGPIPEGLEDFVDFDPSVNPSDPRPFIPLSDYDLPVREITLSTGAGTSGDIDIEGEVDIGEHLQDFDLIFDATEAAEGYLSGSNNFPEDIADFQPFILEPRMSLDQSDPTNALYYVALNVSAGDGAIRFVDGIAATRAAAEGTSDGFNSLTLSVRSGDLQAIESVPIVVNSFIGPDPAPPQVLPVRTRINVTDTEGAGPTTRAGYSAFGQSPTFAGSSFALPSVDVVQIAGPGHIGPPSLNGSTITPPATSPGQVGGLQAVSLDQNLTPDSVDQTQRLDDSLPSNESSSTFVMIGGAGIAQDADLGDTPSGDGMVIDVFEKDHHVVAGEECVQADASGQCLDNGDRNEYLDRGVVQAARAR